MSASLVRAFACAASLVVVPSIVFAQDPKADSATSLATVTVIGTKSDLAEAKSKMRTVPGSVAFIEPAEIRSSRQTNLKEVLRFTPGVFIQPRFGAADESQISVRGSGLRNNFHARGINLLVNGMPYRNADGFTDFESLELLTTEAVEVYKGANALRYGGSTLGGAVNLTTKTGYTAAPVAAYAQVGSFGFYKAQVESGGESNGLDYYASYARTALDGYRDWSSQERDRINLHAGYRFSSAVDARTFYFFARVSEELPGSVNAETLRRAPSTAAPQNVANRWGRDYDLHHVGLQLRAQLDESQRIEVSPYLQYRDIDHPIFEVISQISRDVGVEARYENSASLFGRDNRLTVGFQLAGERMDNRQYRNMQGKHGDLTKNQKDRVSTAAAYFENAFGITDKLTAVLGARGETTTRTTLDSFLANGDQSDKRSFKPLTPRAGVLYDFASGSQVFGNVSRTYEPPLLLELNSLAVPGFIELDGQSAWQLEIGTRGSRGGLAWDLAAYDIELDNEILNIQVRPFPGAPFTVGTYRNADRTRHSGLEAGASWRAPGGIFLRGDLKDHVQLRTAYTYSRFTFVKDSVFAGNDLPGAPPHHGLFEVKYWNPAGFSIAPSIEIVPQSYFVNSENTARNDAWNSISVRAEWVSPRSGLSVFGGASNLTNRRYSASVQVDNAAGNYFEPADPRAFYFGVRWAR